VLPVFDLFFFGSLVRSSHGFGPYPSRWSA
jgi:hypothetical protein